MTASRYIHGTDPEEQRRLADLNGLINELSLAALDPRHGERVLEMGAGLGQFARAIARRTGTPVVGIERSREQMARAIDLARAAGEEALLDLREGDVLAPPFQPGELGSFDVAHARFLLEHVGDPQAVVAWMARAVRSGGRVVLEDDDHEGLRLWPEPAHLMLVWRCYQRTYDRLGCDPIVGRRLVELLARAGLKPKRIEMLPFGACSGSPLLAAFVANLGAILRGAREAILATGGCDGAQVDAALSALAEFGRRDDAAFWYTVSWAEGVRP